jgi:hypothetical protein
MCVGAVLAATTGWKVQRSPSPGASDALAGVVATSSANAWAVGGETYLDKIGQYRSRTLVEHWNGKKWKVQPSPNLGIFNGLNGVAATSSSNAWAVGDYGTGHHIAGQPLIEHWNGKKWKIQSSPSPPGISQLHGVAAISSKNAWAVGFSPNGTLIEHWDGTAWTVQPSPSPGPGFSNLYGVAATSSTNAWAVGYTEGGSLIEHWDGTAWTVQPSPSPGPGFFYLNGVAATSSKNAWAVGSYSNGTTKYHTVVEHWDGTGWTIQPSPQLGGPRADNFLLGVAATSPTNAWAVGYATFAATKAGILHWNGTAWKRQKRLNGDYLNAVAAISSKNAWAVGNRGTNPSAEGTLIVRRARSG